MSTAHYAQEIGIISLADLGGDVPGARPHGTQFFHFRIHFHQKALTSEVHAPPPMGARPPTGNPGSATESDSCGIRTFNSQGK